MRSRMRNPNDVVKFLHYHNYDSAKRITDERIAYRDGSGDGFWENYVAYKYGWVREEIGKCCIKTSAKSKEINFCRSCGVGD